MVVEAIQAASTFEVSEDERLMGCYDRSNCQLNKISRTAVQYTLEVVGTHLETIPQFVQRIGAHLPYNQMGVIFCAGWS
jgi:uncharacterized protein with HEPN domain